MTLISDLASQFHRPAAVAGSKVGHVVPRTDLEYFSDSRCFGVTDVSLLGENEKG